MGSITSAGLCWWAGVAARGGPESCLTLCDPMDGSPPGCSIHGILQAKIMEWGLPRWLSGKESTCQCRRRGFNP